GALSSLPREVIENITRYCSAEGLVALTRVCHSTRPVALEKICHTLDYENWFIDAEAEAERPPPSEQSLAAAAPVMQVLRSTSLEMLSQLMPHVDRIKHLQFGAHMFQGSRSMGGKAQWLALMRERDFVQALGIGQESEVVRNLIKRNPGLVSVSIGDPRIRRDVLIPVLAELPLLQQLELVGRARDQNALQDVQVFFEILATCQNLTSLTYAGSMDDVLGGNTVLPLDDQGAHHSLVSLKLDQWHIKHAGIIPRALALTPNLKCLSLPKIHSQAQIAAAQTLKTSNIQSLTLFDLHFRSGAVAEAFVTAKELWSLSMFDCSGISINSLNNGLSYAASTIKELRINQPLDQHGCFFGRVSTIFRMRRLDTLFLSWPTDVADIPSAHNWQLHSLRYITLAVHINGNSASINRLNCLVHNLSRLPQIRHMYLDVTSEVVLADVVQVPAKDRTHHLWLEIQFSPPANSPYIPDELEYRYEPIEMYYEPAPVFTWLPLSAW
ncbi:hypothetical protein BGZ82_002364, partial [Podila clonocystis]